MPRLSNERHEAFARHFVSTWSIDRAASAVKLASSTAYNLIAENQKVVDRIRELSEAMLKAADITAERVMLELGRVAFADIRKIVDERGVLKPLAELDDDTAAALAGIESETKVERDGTETDLATGEQKPRFVSVTTTKVKRYDKVPALNILAKHFKLVGDEGDGINALANALADRLKSARRRVITAEPLERIEDASIIEREHAPANKGE